MGVAQPRLFPLGISVPSEFVMYSKKSKFMTFPSLPPLVFHSLSLLSNFFINSTHPSFALKCFSSLHPSLSLISPSPPLTLLLLPTPVSFPSPQTIHPSTKSLSPHTKHPPPPFPLFLSPESQWRRRLQRGRLTRKKIQGDLMPLACKR